MMCNNQKRVCMCVPKVEKNESILIHERALIWLVSVLYLKSYNFVFFWNVKWRKHEDSRKFQAMELKFLTLKGGGVETPNEK